MSASLLSSRLASQTQAVQIRPGATGDGRVYAGARGSAGRAQGRRAVNHCDCEGVPEPSEGGSVEGVLEDGAVDSARGRTALTGHTHGEPIAGYALDACTVQTWSTLPVSKSARAHANA